MSRPLRLRYANASSILAPQSAFTLPTSLTVSPLREYEVRVDFAIREIAHQVILACRAS